MTQLVDHVTRSWGCNLEPHIWHNDCLINKIFKKKKGGMYQKALAPLHYSIQNETQSRSQHHVIYNSISSKLNTLTPWTTSLVWESSGFGNIWIFGGYGLP